MSKKDPSKSPFRVMLLVIYIALMAGGAYYEYGAFKIFSVAEKLERKGNSQTAKQAYRYVVEKTSLSFFVLLAKSEVGRHPTRTFTKSSPFGFKPYSMHGLPFFASFICCIVLSGRFLLRLFRFGSFNFINLTLAIASGTLFFSQATNAGIIEHINRGLDNLAKQVTGDTMAIYAFSYFLILMTMFMTLSMDPHEGRMKVGARPKGVNKKRAALEDY